QLQTGVVVDATRVLLHALADLNVVPGRRAQQRRTLVDRRLLGSGLARAGSLNDQLIDDGRVLRAGLRDHADLRRGRNRVRPPKAGVAAELAPASAIAPRAVIARTAKNAAFLTLIPLPRN